MKTKLIATAVAAALAMGVVTPAAAEDGWDRWIWKRQQQQYDQERDRAWDRRMKRERSWDRNRGTERQRARDAEQHQYWKERDQEYKLGTPPR